MKFKWFKTSVHTWNLLATTQSAEKQVTNFLFINELGEFKTIQLDGVIEDALESYINKMRDYGMQSIVFNRDGKKLLLMEAPTVPTADNLPVRPPRNAQASTNTNQFPQSVV